MCHLSYFVSSFSFPLVCERTTKEETETPFARHRWQWLAHRQKPTERTVLNIHIWLGVNRLFDGIAIFGIFLFFLLFTVSLALFTDVLFCHDKTKTNSIRWWSRFDSTEKIYSFFLPSPYFTFTFMLCIYLRLHLTWCRACLCVRAHFSFSFDLVFSSYKLNVFDSTRSTLWDFCFPRRRPP